MNRLQDTKFIINRGYSNDMNENKKESFVYINKKLYLCASILLYN